MASDEASRNRPARLGSLSAHIAKLDQQIAKGTENLLLLAPADLPAASTVLAQWRDERESVQAELDACEEVEPVAFEADSILAELDELEQHLTGDSVPLAKTAFRRVFESVVLYWEQVSPRRRELVRAEITPRFPFCLTANMSTRAQKELSLGLRDWGFQPQYAGAGCFNHHLDTQTFGFDKAPVPAEPATYIGIQVGGVLLFCPLHHSVKPGRPSKNICALYVCKLCGCLFG